MTEKKKFRTEKKSQHMITIQKLANAISIIRKDKNSPFLLIKCLMMTSILKNFLQRDHQALPPARFELAPSPL